jgi:hypothetical protein
MAAVNQLFLSAALELDMPFDKKLSLLDDPVFINIIISQTEKDIEALKIDQQSNPLNNELALQLALKRDKLSFLQHQIELFAKIDPNKTKSALLDIQFEVFLREHLINTTLKEPFAQEYAQIVRKFYTDNTSRFLSVEDSSTDLLEAINAFEKNNIANYLLVSEAFSQLYKFGLKLPEKNLDVKVYINGINKLIVTLQLRNVP